MRIARVVRNWCGALVGRWAFSGFRPARVAANRAFHAALRQRRQFELMPEALQTEYALDALRRQVAYSRAHVPFYERLWRGQPFGFPESFEDYREAPILTKSDLRANGVGLISSEYSVSGLTRESTGGSTGEPVVVYLAPEDIGWRLSGIQRHLAMLGGEHGRPVGTLYGGELEVNAKRGFGARVKNWLTNYSPHDCFRLDEGYLLSVHRDFARFQPDVIVAYASAIYRLAVLLQQLGIRPSYPGRAILTGAEKLEDYQRAVLEAVFPAVVVERYGSRELSLMAYQIPGHGLRFRVDRCYCHLEPDGEPDSQGFAPVLVTLLHARAMPLLRYQIGDLARFPSNWQPDGSVQWLEQIAGRTVDYIRLPSGRVVHSIEFPHLFKDLDVLAYQVRQDKSGAVMVHVVPGPQHGELERERSQRVIKQNLAGVPVQFSYVTEIERTRQAKLRPVVSDYSPTSGLGAGRLVDTTS